MHWQVASYSQNDDCFLTCLLIGYLIFIEAVPVLLSSISVQLGLGDREASQMAIENALSAIAKIAFQYYSKLNMNQIVPAWLSALPATQDETEFETIYTFLAVLIER